ncbi:MAG: hypothetical protein GTN78_22495 [Gemmatimonadales bacterium]|nr:hypothetical protein [Gemmatimonadales bacterium]NIR02937.1 hypothetical protein [Gemmatimonadales bacterium]
MLNRGVVLVVAGIGIGLAGALALTRLLGAVLFQVAPSDPTTYTVVSLFFVAVAVVACLLAAWRAVRVDPMVALQVE